MKTITSIALLSDQKVDVKCAESIADGTIQYRFAIDNKLIPDPSSIDQLQLSLRLYEQTQPHAHPEPIHYRLMIGETIIDELVIDAQFEGQTALLNIGSSMALQGFKDQKRGSETTLHLQLWRPSGLGIDTDLESATLKIATQSPNAQGRHFSGLQTIPYIQAEHQRGYFIQSYFPQNSGSLFVGLAELSELVQLSPRLALPSLNPVFGTGGQDSPKIIEAEKAQVDAYRFTHDFVQLIRQTQWLRPSKQPMHLEVYVTSVGFAQEKTIDQRGRLQIHHQLVQPDIVFHECAHHILHLLGIPSATLSPGGPSHQHIGSVLHEGLCDILSEIAQGVYASKACIADQVSPYGLPDWRIEGHTDYHGFHRDFAEHALPSASTAAPSAHMSPSSTGQAACVWKNDEALGSVSSELPPHTESGWLRHWTHVLLEHPSVTPLFNQGDSRQDLIFYTTMMHYVLDLAHHLGLMFQSHPKAHYSELQRNMQEWFECEPPVLQTELPGDYNVEVYKRIHQAAQHAWSQMESEHSQ